MLSPWARFRKLFKKLAIEALKTNWREKTSQKPLKKHAQTMKKSMQKTMRFLTSLFLDFFSILERFGAPKWTPKSLQISFSGVGDPPPSDFGPKIY